MSAFTPVQLALPSLTPSLALELIPYGLTIHKIYVQADAKTHDLLIGPQNPPDFADPNHRFHNTIVGRYSNRLPVGTHSLERKGTSSTLTLQSNESPRVNLHGGPTGFDQAVWQTINPTQATLFSDAEKSTMSSIPSSAIFRHTSPDGDQGFPGALLVEVLVGLLSPGHTTIVSPTDEYALGSIILVYRAKLLGDAKVVTPVNLTQHWGFNLGASLKDDPSSLSIKDHILTIKASNTIDLEPDFLSSGKLNPVEGTHHHHASKPIGEGFPNPGYDEFYVFDRPADQAAPPRVPLASLPTLNLLRSLVEPTPGAAAQPLVELSSPKSGLKLAFDSNQSGVQFYTANFNSPAGARKKIHGGTGELGQGDGYGPGTAAFLEFHEPLAAWLHPATTPSGFDTLLHSDELYHNFVKVAVTFRDPHAA